MREMLVAVVAVNLAAVTNAGRADEPPATVVLKGSMKDVLTVAWAADGKSLATGSYDRTARVWDPATGQQTALLPGLAPEGVNVLVLAFSPDLKVVAAAYRGDVTLRAVPDGKVLVKFDAILDRKVEAAFPQDVYAMAYSPDGKRLVTGGSVAAPVRGGTIGGIAIVRDAETGKLIHKSQTLQTAVCSVAWGPDGKRFAAGTNGTGGEGELEGEVGVWDAETGKNLDTFKLRQNENPIWLSAGDVALGPDSKRIAVPLTVSSRGNPFGAGLEDRGGPIRIWDLGAGKPAKLVKELKTSMKWVVFNPDGKSLAGGGQGNFVKVWDVETGDELATLPSPGGISAIAFSPDGKSLAGGSGDGSVRIWATPTAK